jgi:hypothetical protein
LRQQFGLAESWGELSSQADEGVGSGAVGQAMGYYNLDTHYTGPMSATRSITANAVAPETKMSNGDSTMGEDGPYRETLDRIDAARIDGRARNVLYRLKQLHVMHSFLMRRKVDFVKALQSGICSNLF